ncbi:Inositol-1-monophosphatase [hydrothermal vent metagenome]|uniref:inositol-phosphate phosphatase n=1 Tax=hydrothermal vent metagenome TaxID=652676 RepID=A0A3B0SPY3_9ZZZZ
MDDLHVAISAARAGAEIVKAQFGGPQNPQYKGNFDPVTAVDHAAEKAILDVLVEERPDDQIMAEESGGESHASRHWIVDPLDGTVNFVHSIPHVSISVALYDGEVGLVGVVFDPLRDELFTATLGGGAYLNSHVISVSDVDDLNKSVVATGFPYNHDIYADSLSIVLREVLREVNGIRRMGSAALDLAWVAAGRYDGYWELGIAPWDGAAGIILVREAGGTVTDPFGRPTTPSKGLVVSSNGAIHDRLRTIVEAWMPPHLIEP